MRPPRWSGNGSVKGGSPVALAEVADFLRKTTGLVFPGAQRSRLEEGIARAIQRAGVSDSRACLARLAREPLLLEDLVAEVTVGETYFFRDPLQMELIQRRIFPLLGAGGWPVRIWSAGCASGEEPYTLAMAAMESGLDNTRILGTDISRAALRRARAGRYRSWSLRRGPPGLESRYFNREGDEHVLSPDIRERVDFRYLNLAEDVYPGLASGIMGMDLILCRNVLIYFDEKTVIQVGERLLRSLSPEGWLLLGAADPLLSDRMECQVVLTEAGLAYRRPDAPVTPSETFTFLRPRSRSGPSPSPPEPSAPLPEWAAAFTVAEPEGRPEAMRARSDRARSPAGRVEVDPDPPPVGAEPGGEEAAAALQEIRMLADQGRFPEASLRCTRALERFSGGAGLHYLQAVLLSEVGMHDDAARSARRALYLEPDMAVAHLTLGAARFRTGDRQGARRAFETALTLLEGMDQDQKVREADGARAGRLVSVARARLELLGDEP